MVAIKICGVRTTEIASLCEELGIEFAGLNFVPTSRRAVDVGTAKNVRQALTGTRAVGVFRDSSMDEMHHVVGAVGLDYVQLHGAETPDTCARMRDSGVGVIKALPISEDILDRMLAYQHSVNILLIDAPVAGSGIAWDLSKLVQRDAITCPVFLAGGLTPETVARAIQATEPDGVDVASGIESACEIDPERVRAFYNSVHNSAKTST